MTDTPITDALYGKLAAAEAELTTASKYHAKDLDKIAAQHQLIADDIEREDNCRKLLAKWDTSDSYGVVPLEDLIERALAELATARNDALAFLRITLQLDENGDNDCGAAPQEGWETGYCAGLRAAYRALKDKPL